MLVVPRAPMGIWQVGLICITAHYENLWRDCYTVEQLCGKGQMPAVINSVSKLG